MSDDESFCAVCEESASGYHYGAYTCEGCKSFFKRTVQKNLTSKYVCNCDGKCDVRKSGRSRCQACRLAKCFDAGMVEEGVRKEKKRGGRSFYPLKKFPKSEEDLQATSCSHSEPHDDFSEYSSDIITKLMQTDPLAVPPGDPWTPEDPEVSQQNKIEILTRLSSAITKELRIIVEWAKVLPGFASLQREDQMAMLTAAGMEIIVFRLIYRSIPYEDQINMNSTTVFTREDSYSVLNTELVDAILDVVARLRSISIDDVEFACLMSILLTDPEIPGLKDKEAVEHLQGTFLSGMKEHMETKYADQPGRFAKLLLRLPALRDVCSKGYEYFLLVRAKLEGEVPMSTLLKEMFESARV